MKKSRFEILLIALTVLALSAGVVAGLLAARLPGANSGANQSPPPVPPPDALADQLNLSPDQRAQMRDIWEGVRTQVHQTFDDAEKLQEEHDRAVVAMLNDEQKAQYAKISKDFADRYDSLTKERNKLFDNAVEKTKTLLNPQQRAKYEEILKTHVRPGPPPGRGGHAGKMFVVPADSPATRPS